MATAEQDTRTDRRGVIAGYGDGDGSGYGDGYGYGEDLERCRPRPVVVSARDLIRAGASGDQVARFRRVFPGGAVWPDDRDAALAAGLDVGWAQRALGLLPVLAVPGEAALHGVREHETMEMEG